MVVNNKRKLFGIEVNIGDIPVDYCWSGYVKSREEYEQKNFYVWFDGEQKNIICSDENAVALCDYISNYLLHSDVISDMESIFSPGYNQWFFLAWEQCITNLEECPQWIKDIFSVLVEVGVISTTSNEGISYYAILNVDNISNDSLPKNTNDKIEKLCKKNVNKYWEEAVESEDELIEPECNEWGMRLYREFVDSHDTIEIYASCGSENGPGIGCGITMPIKELSKNGDLWIYEGMSDCISENWEEFDEVAEETKSECLKYYTEKGMIPSSEDEIKATAKAILARKLGKYDIDFETDRDDIELDYNISSGDISEAIYDCVISNFAIVHCVLYDLKNK